MGIQEVISPSNYFPRIDPAAPAEDTLLSVHHCNWQSAESEPEIVQELIDKEVAEGWVEVYHGSLDDARESYPKGLAVGKLGLALSDTRPPRLVMDSSVCGVNHLSQISEKIHFAHIG